jgi:hypothetical protein
VPTLQSSNRNSMDALHYSRSVKAHDTTPLVLQPAASLRTW